MLKNLRKSFRPSKAEAAEPAQGNSGGAAVAAVAAVPEAATTPTPTPAASGVAAPSAIVPSSSASASASSPASPAPEAPATPPQAQSAQPTQPTQPAQASQPTPSTPAPPPAPDPAQTAQDAKKTVPPAPATDTGKDDQDVHEDHDGDQGPGPEAANGAASKADHHAGTGDSAVEKSPASSGQGKSEADGGSAGAAAAAAAAVSSTSEEREAAAAALAAARVQATLQAEGGSQADADASQSDAAKPKTAKATTTTKPKPTAAQAKPRIESGKVAAQRFGGHHGQALAASNRRNRSLPLFDGWLSLKDWKGDSWRGVWCILYEGSLQYQSEDQRGSIHLGSGATRKVRLVPFSDPNLPPEVFPYADDKPFGFMLDIGQAFFFDAKNSGNYELWIRNLKRALEVNDVIDSKAAVHRTTLPVHTARFQQYLGQSAQEEPGPAAHPSWKPIPYHGSGPDDIGAPFQWLQVAREKLVCRATPSNEGIVVGETIQQGQLLQARTEEFRDKQNNVWLELSPFEAWRRRVDVPRRAFVMLAESQEDAVNMHILDDDEWPEPDVAENYGLKWSVRDCCSVRPPLWPDPQEVLNFWQPATSSSKSSAAPPPPHDTQGIAACAVVFVGTPMEVVEDWLLYHLKLQFTRLYLFFDGAEAEYLDMVDQIARVAKASGQVVVAEPLTTAWWSWAKEHSRHFRCQEELWARGVVQDYLNYRDYDAIRQICCDIATQDAARHRMGWMLFLDVWEVLYLPSSMLRMDAPAFFALIPDEVDLVRLFTNEGVPERPANAAWFDDVTLFKLALPFMRRDWYAAVASVGTTAEERAAAARTGEGSADASFSKSRSKQQQQQQQQQQQRQQQRQQQQQKQSEGLDFGSDKLALSESFMSQVVADGRPQFHEPADVHVDSIFDRTLALVNSVRAEAAGRLNLPEVSDHLLWQKEGRCAVRLAGVSEGTKHIQMRVPDSTRSFANAVDGKKVGLQTMQMDGPSAPVILHFGHTDYASWVEHYSNISDFPTMGCCGQSNTAAHLISRKLVKRGLPKQLEQFWDLYIANNAFGELPLMASQGLLRRIGGVQKILGTARQQTMKQLKHHRMDYQSGDAQVF